MSVYLAVFLILLETFVDLTNSPARRSAGLPKSLIGVSVGLDR
jgi:hypothetical protein